MTPPLLADGIGLAGQGLLLAALILALPGARRLKTMGHGMAALAAALVILLAATLLPLSHGISLAQALRGIWGDLSPTTLLLCLLALIPPAWLLHGERRRQARDRRHGARPCPPFCAEAEGPPPTGPAWTEAGLLSSPTRRLLLGLILVAGLMLYPATLGSGDVDPYRWGFAPWGLGSFIAVVGLAACQRYPGLALILATDLLAYALRLTGSDNLWDYLVDPLLVTYALFATLLAPALRRRLAFFRRQPA